MADIELIIKIPEKTYNALTHTEFDANLVVDDMRKSIVHGTPLPKGHGRLIILSEDAVKESLELLSFSHQKWISEVGLSDATVGFIEADKEEE